MVRILAGYTIEQDELVRFLKAQGWGPGPGDPEVTVEDTWMNFISWRGAQPRRGDPKTLFPWPQYWYDKDGNPVHAFMTRCSNDVANLNLRFREMPIDVEIRDRFINRTDGVLNPDKMQFWSFPETFVHVPLSIPYY